MRLENFLRAAGDGTAARRRGIDQIVHWADKMAKRKGYLTLEVDKMARADFDEIDVPQEFDGKRAWTKTMHFAASDCGWVKILFVTFESPKDDPFYGDPIMQRAGAHIEPTNGPATVRRHVEDDGA